MNRRLIVRLIVPAVILVVGGFALGYSAGRDQSTAATNQPGQLLSVLATALKGKSAGVDTTIIDRTWDAIKQEYVRQPVDDKTLFYGAVSGVVNALGDRYSSFFDPSTAKVFKQELGETAFDGIGAEIGARDDILVIIAPLPDSPAEKAGLQAGDRLYKIDDALATDFTVDQAVEKIRGKRGTIVTLTVVRDGTLDPLEIKITRDNITVDSVRWTMKETPKKKSVAVIEISHFTEDTPALFRSIAQEVVLKKPEAIILDLRNNPGGFLEAASDVASAFLDSGQPVVLEIHADKSETVIRTSGIPTLKGVKTIILVNGGSASAAEILAGALQDYGVATVVGEQTFGKGSVQSLIEFGDASSLKLTVATWSTPKGRSIDKTGIAPDIEVKEPAERKPGQDPVLDKAYELLDS